MKKIILILLIALFTFGCGTTFEQRKPVYVAIYKKAASIVHVVGPVAAKIYLNEKVKDGKLDQSTADHMYNSLTDSK